MLLALGSSAEKAVVAEKGPTAAYVEAEHTLRELAQSLIEFCDFMRFAQKCLRANF